MGDYFSMRWINNRVRMLDQRLLPHKVEYRNCDTCSDVAYAIREMIIRGAPAIGVAAGFGLALTALHSQVTQIHEFISELKASADELRRSRPTAVNLYESIQRIESIVLTADNMTLDQIKSMVIEEAHKIAEEDVRTNLQMAQNGQQFIPDKANIIHHCNTGALATTGIGTALGVIRMAHENGKKLHVYVDETRPRLQGARLTSWELKQLGIPHTVIVDGASGYMMSKMRIDACFVGCDRIAANGDVANKIGTYNLALAAWAHEVPFYSVGPTTSIDFNIAYGNDIPIEERSPNEITHIGQMQITPDEVEVANPAFDITPSKYITAIITDKGVATEPYDQSIIQLMNG
jgi:methylthioribose-1-phosphate isomerase